MFGNSLVLRAVTAPCIKSILSEKGRLLTVGLSYIRDQSLPLVDVVETENVTEVVRRPEDMVWLFGQMTSQALALVRLAHVRIPPLSHI